MQACDNAVGFEAHYTAGIPIDAANGSYARPYELVLGPAERLDGDGTLPLLQSLPHLQQAIDEAHETFAPFLADFAPHLAREPVVYVAASGADLGAACSFAICVPMEMQRIDSQGVHANELFGPSEVVDPGRALVLLKGLDATRPIEERAEAFLRRFGSNEKVLVLDAARLDLQGIAPEVQGNPVPLIFFEVLWRFAYAIADLRGIPMLEGRRYMTKTTDY